MNSLQQIHNSNLELLQQSGSSDIELLIDDIELLETGYTINYIIDPFDVFEYSFPYGIRFDRKKELDKIGDEMIAYSYIFNNYSPVILDEYRTELQTNRNNIQVSISSEINKNLFEKLIAQLEKDKNDETAINKIYEELSRSASFLLSTALLTNSFVAHFDDIYSNKLQIDHFRLKSGNRQDEKIILESFKSNRRSDWSEDAFRQWVIKKENTGYFNRMSEFDIFREYKNTYRDYIVIDRICTINKALQNNARLADKHLFLYYSSAKKSEDIFSTEITKKHLPTINGIGNYNILRSAKHSYLLFLFDDKNINKLKETLIKLKELKDKKAKGDLISKSQKTESALVEQISIEDIRKKYQAILERTSIENQINKHENYRKSLENKIRELQKNKNYPSKLGELYKNLLAEAKKATENIGLIEIDLTYSVHSSLKNLVELLLDEKGLNLHKGNDGIKGNYHHLPILLFFDNKALDINNLKTLLLEVIEYVVKSPRIRHENIDEFFKAITELYKKSEDFKEAEINYSSILIKSLLYLILPNKNESQQEEETYIFIRDTFTRLKYMKEEFKKWECEYLYFLIWSSRRDSQIENSLKLAEDALRDNHDDPRFHHGKCLALYNKFTNPTNLEIGNVYDLEVLVTSAERAIDLYETKLATNNYRKGYEKFINGSVVALQNLVLYCISLFFLTKLESGEKLHFEVDSVFSKYTLDYLRNDLLGSIKDFEENENKQNIKDFPELAHTESVLELCEAIYNLPVASDKIEEAYVAIQKALEAEPKSNLYKNTEIRINKWRRDINRL